MLRLISLSGVFARLPGLAPSRVPLRIAVVATVLVAAPTAWWMWHGTATGRAPVDATARRAAAALAIDPRFLEPRPTITGAGGGPRFGLAPSAPSGFRVAAAPPPALPPLPGTKPRVAPQVNETGSLATGLAAPNPVPTRPAPLPVPRPADLGPAARADGQGVAARPKPRRNRAASLSAPAEDNRSFFERLFGVPAAPAVSYASLPGAPTVQPPGSRALPSIEPGTAIYDITARTVTLPNGERLEAHSGLGEQLDDPRYVHVRMRGATPPGTYELTEREGLFHGVRALRLTPVGGAAAIHYRAGLLAHTFMLGPRGDSNGCISFRDYGRFLQAYLRGEIRRLVVVPGSGFNWPSFAGGATPPPRGDA